MAQVDPYIVPLPPKLATDPELGPYFTYQQKFLHDLWQRTGGGTDFLDGAAQLSEDQTFTGAVTFSGSINLDSIALQVNGVQVLTAQQSSVADPAALNANAVSYTPHASGSTTVTSNAATDLDTTAAKLDELVDEYNSLRTDVTNVRTQLIALLTELRDHGAIAT